MGSVTDSIIAQDDDGPRVADPLPVPLPNPDAFAKAGKFGDTVDKAARFAGLPAEAVSALAAASSVAERHMHGYGPADGDVGRLTAALAAFVAAMRERARAERAVA